MELLESIRSRISIRGYKSTPIPKEILQEILEIATCTPSANNTQPWEFIVIGGKVLEDLNKALEEQFLAGVAPVPDFFKYYKPYTGIYRKRQTELAAAIFRVMGIAREDKDKRKQWNVKMLHSFGAPIVILISVDEAASSFFGVFGLGAVSQTIALAALNYGLGTCIMADIVKYPDVVRQVVGIPESKKLAMSISIGYPDWDLPINKLRIDREPFKNIVTWHGI